MTTVRLAMKLFPGTMISGPTQTLRHNLQWDDALLPQMQADALLADKAFDADERAIEPPRAVGKKRVIPPKSNRKVQRTFDREMY